MLAWWADWWPRAQADGWSTVTVTRAAGASCGTSDTYWLQPGGGRRFRSRAEIAAWRGIGQSHAPGDEAEPN
jgi:hypothetical protein